MKSMKLRKQLQERRKNMQIYEELVARGLIAQVTNEEEIKKDGKRGKGYLLHWL